MTSRVEFHTLLANVRRWTERFQWASLQLCSGRSSRALRESQETAVDSVAQLSSGKSFILLVRLLQHPKYVVRRDSHFFPRPRLGSHRLTCFLQPAFVQENHPAQGRVSAGVLNVQILSLRGCLRSMPFGTTKPSYFLSFPRAADSILLRPHAGELSLSCVPPAERIITRKKRIRSL